MKGLVILSNSMKLENSTNWFLKNSRESFRNDELIDGIGFSTGGRLLGKSNTLSWFHWDTKVRLEYDHLNYLWSALSDAKVKISTEDSREQMWRLHSSVLLTGRREGTNVLLYQDSECSWLELRQYWNLENRKSVLKFSVNYNGKIIHSAWIKTESTNK